VTPGSTPVVVNKIPNTNMSKGKRDRIDGLVNYVVAPQTESADEKCVYWNESGFDSSEPGLIKEQLLVTSLRAVRSPDTIAHYVISWSDGLAPTNDQVDEAARIVLSHLGAADHRALWAQHADTDNVHVHVVLDRVHPLTGVVLDLYRDVPKIHRAGKMIAEAQGWGPSLDSRYTIGRGAAEAHEPALSQRAILMELKTGQTSAERYAQAQVPGIIAASSSWADFHRRLDAAAMTYAPQGSGAVIKVGDTAVKASRTTRSASLARLQTAFGPYEPAPSPGEKGAPRPSQVEFIAARDAHRADQAAARKALGSAHADERNALKTMFGGKYQAIVTDRSVTWAKRDVMRRILAAQRSKATASLLERQRIERSLLRRSQMPFPKYQEWVRTKGRRADAEPAPVAAGSARGGTVTTSPAPPEVLDIRGYEVSVHGTEVHYNLAGRSLASMIDHGRSITIHEANDAAVRAMLQLANTRWGGLQLDRAAPDVTARFTAIAKAEHFALYDRHGHPASPTAQRRQATGPAGDTTALKPPRRTS
jgi:hypothetical protein